MAHLKKVDPGHTIIMVQPQNETGTYGSIRDYSPAAEKLFQGSVPRPLVQALGRRPGRWAEVFGDDADEFFHAWHIGRFVELGALELAFRFSRVDLDDGGVRGGTLGNWSAGLNWYATYHTKLMLNAILANLHGAEPVRIFQMRLQVAF